MKILRVGDPHIRPSNLEEAHRLMTFVKEKALATKADRLEILGDLFHTHAVVRLEVLEFWTHWLEEFSSVIETVVLVGNHDMTGDHKSTTNALDVFKRNANENLRIIDKPTQIGYVGYMPYYHDNDAFVRDGNRLSSSGTSVLVCHTTFSGSQYDNGFYAPTGVNPDELNFHTIISGHIHKEQIIAGGKVDYPGTAKWDSLSDANEQKGIWLYEHDEVTGKVLSRDMISTAHVCTPIISVVWNEGEEQPTFPENAKVSVELVGSSAWVTKRKTTLKGRVSVKTKITDKANRVARKSGNSLENFLMNVYNTNMGRERLLSYAKEIGIV